MKPTKIVMCIEDDFVTVNVPGAKHPFMWERGTSGDQAADEVAKLLEYLGYEPIWLE
jgi:hypothetical protein